MADSMIHPGMMPHSDAAIQELMDQTQSDLQYLKDQLAQIRSNSAKMIDPYDYPTPGILVGEMQEIQRLTQQIDQQKHSYRMYQFELQDRAAREKKRQENWLEEKRLEAEVMKANQLKVSRARAKSLHNWLDVTNEL